MPVLNQPKIDTAHAVVARMANVMRTRAGASGSCTRDELIAAGFSAKEIELYGHSAATRAQDRSIRRADLQLDADRAEIRAVRSGPPVTEQASAVDLLRELVEAQRLDRAYGTAYVRRTPRVISRCQAFLAGRPVPKRPDVLAPEFRQ